MPLIEADFHMLLDRATGRPVNEATVTLTELLAAYARNDAANFNKKLAEYRKLVGNYETVLQSSTKQLKDSGVANAEILAQPKIDFEVFYNQFSPFYYACVLYFFAFLFGAASWIGWTRAVAARFDLAAVVHIRTAHVRVGRPHLHFRPAADHEPVFNGHFHRLGGRADGAHVRVNLSARIGEHRRVRYRFPHVNSGIQPLARR